MIRSWLLRGFFRSAPGGAKMLHETLCVAQARLPTGRAHVLADMDRLQWLIDAIEASGAYPGRSR